MSEAESNGSSCGSAAIALAVEFQCCPMGRFTLTCDAAPGKDSLRLNIGANGRPPEPQGAASAPVSPSEKDLA